MCKVLSLNCTTLQYYTHGIFMTVKSVRVTYKDSPVFTQKIYLHV